MSRILQTNSRKKEMSQEDTDEQGARGGLGTYSLGDYENALQFCRRRNLRTIKLPEKKSPNIRMKNWSRPSPKDVGKVAIPDFLVDWIFVGKQQLRAGFLFRHFFGKLDHTAADAECLVQHA